MSYYYDDIDNGKEFRSDSRTITEADVVNFSGISGDFNALHTDVEYARTTPYGARIAHGALIFSIGTGLIARMRLFDGTVLGFLGVTDWTFRRPVFIGDTVHLEMTLVKRRLTSDSQRGIVDRHCRIVNQDGQTVQEGVLTVMLKARNYDNAEHASHG